MIIFKALLFSIIWAAISCATAQAVDLEPSSAQIEANTKLQELLVRLVRPLLEKEQFALARAQLRLINNYYWKQSGELAAYYAECYRKWGMQLLEKGNTSSAFAKFEECLYYDPEDVKTRDRLHKMIEELKLDPQSADTRLDLAKQARLRGDVEAAIVELEAAYKINPDYKTLMQLGSLLEMRGQDERARDAYLCILQRHQPDPETKERVQHWLQNIEKRTAQKK